MTTRKLLAIHIASALGLAASLPAFAADAQDDNSVERVEVTGSRIKRTDVAGQSPILTLQRADMEKTGLNSIGEVLQQLTSGGKALNAKFNSSGNFGFPADGGGIGAGSAQVDLRNLESKRVLVLVDGRRWVNESSASGVGGSVDLNTIPMSIVERIEVLEDGASAIYGSDAIAGVVNVITRKDFDGVEINAYYGEYDKGDGETTKGDITIGGSTDKFSGVFVASYNNQEEISSADRSISREPVPGTGVTRGSSGTPQGRLIFCDPNVQDCAAGDAFDVTLNNGAIPNYNGGNPTAAPGTYHEFGLDDRFNFAPYNLLLTPSERQSMYTQVRYNFTPDVTWYTKALYNNRQSTNQAAPEPIFIGSDAGTGGLGDTIGISALNPYNPTGIDLVAGQNFYLLGRRPLEGGPRIFNQDVDTWYFNTGLEGDFTLGGKVYSWDVSYIKSENTAEQKFKNGYNLRRIQIALGDPTLCAANPGCVPLDLFGGQGPNGQGTITQDMLDWIRMDTKDSSKQKLETWSANITGDLVDLWAGPLAFAAGYEWRDYYGSFTPDQVRTVGESQDSAAIPTSGQYDVSEFYAEFTLPLASDMAFAKLLELNVASRYSDYSTFGSETTSKVGLKWKPIDDLLVRGTWAEGFRAPFIGELYGLAQFGAPITDPCSNAVDNSGSALDTKCQALGVPVGYEQINTQIITNTGGNPDLDPESSDSYTYGFVYSPSWARGAFADRLDFEVSYYHHEIDDAIQAPDAQDLLDACVDSGNPNSEFCNGITRTNTGQINRFTNLVANIGKIETDGWDFKANWGLDSSVGMWTVGFQATYVDDYKASDIFGNEFSRTVGVEVNDSAIPEWQWNSQIGWSMNDVEVTWSTRFIDEVEESCSDFRDNTSLSLANLGLCSNPNSTDNSLSTNKLDSTFYNDVQVAWSNPLGATGLRLSFGINNVLDEDAPECVTCSLNGYDAGTYELPGRFYYMQATYRQ